MGSLLRIIFFYGTVILTHITSKAMVENTMAATTGRLSPPIMILKKCHFARKSLVTFNLSKLMLLMTNSSQFLRSPIITFTFFQNLPTAPVFHDPIQSSQSRFFLSTDLHLAHTSIRHLICIPANRSHP